jgi:hypothetical protein
MKRIFGLSVILLIAFSFAKLGKDVEVSLELPEKTISNKKIEDLPLSKSFPSLSQKTAKIKEPTLKRDVASSDKSVLGRKKLLENFEYSELPELKLRLIRNFQAVPTTNKHTSLVSGYELVETSNPSEFNLVYDKTKGAYGVWTREIIVYGQAGIHRSLQQDLNLEEVGRGPGSTIFKVPENVELEELLSVEGARVKLDIHYARVYPN